MYELLIHIGREHYAITAVSIADGVREAMKRAGKVEAEWVGVDDRKTNRRIRAYVNVEVKQNGRIWYERITVYE